MPIFHRALRQGPHYRQDNTKAADMLRQPPSFIQHTGVTQDPYDLKTRQNREHTVCFTGHRILRKEDSLALGQLDALLEALYLRGYRDYLCGGALGFDQFAAKHVISLRDKYPDIRLIFCLPCADQSARWRAADCEHYEQLLYLADEIRVLSPQYYDGCMQARNAYMVDRSYLCVAYMKKLGGGTLSTVRYSLSEDVPVVNIAVPSAVDEFTQAL